MRNSGLRFLLLAFISSVVATTLLPAEPVIYSAVDENPQPLRTPPPEYPSDLQSKGITGMVVLELVVDDSGKVDQVEIVKSTENDFNQPSIAAVKAWRFKPAKKDGQFVWVRFKLPLKFDPKA